MKLGANIRLREDGRYEARYFKGKSEAGRAKYGSVYGKTPEEADKNRTELLKSLQGSGSQARLCKERKENVRRMKNPEALSENKAKLLESIFSSDTDGAAFGFSLCLHMGISVAELCVLRYCDFDFGSNLLTINKKMLVKYVNKGVIVPCEDRKLPIPQAVHKDYNLAGRNKNCFVLTDSEVAIESTVSAGYLLKRVLSINPELHNIQPDELQMTFIRRVMESGVGCSSVEAITGIPSAIAA